MDTQYTTKLEDNEGTVTGSEEITKTEDQDNIHEEKTVHSYNEDGTELTEDGEGKDEEKMDQTELTSDQENTSEEQVHNKESTEEISHLQFQECESDNDNSESTSELEFPVEDIEHENSELETSYNINDDNENADQEVYNENEEINKNPEVPLSTVTNKILNGTEQNHNEDMVSTDNSNGDTLTGAEDREEKSEKYENDLDDNQETATGAPEEIVEEQIKQTDTDDEEDNSQTDGINFGSEKIQTYSAVLSNTIEYQSAIKCEEETITDNEDQQNEDIVTAENNNTGAEMDEADDDEKYENDLNDSQKRTSDESKETIEEEEEQIQSDSEETKTNSENLQNEDIVTAENHNLDSETAEEKTEKYETYLDDDQERTTEEPEEIEEEKSKQTDTDNAVQNDFAERLNNIDDIQSGIISEEITKTDDEYQQREILNTNENEDEIELNQMYDADDKNDDEENETAMDLNEETSAAANITDEGNNSGELNDSLDDCTENIKITELRLDGADQDMDLEVYDQDENTDEKTYNEQFDESKSHIKSLNNEDDETLIGTGDQNEINT